MASRKLHKLSARDIARRKTAPGKHSDGGCLYLWVTNKLSASWAFISARTGQRGWGSDLSPEGTRRARERAAEWRALIARGADPKEIQTAATAPRMTFGQCADAILESKKSEWRIGKHAAQWATALKVDCAPIRDLPVDKVDTAAVLDVLKSLWQTKHVTASRIRGRIEATLDFATAHKWRSGENPARWRGRLALILPRRRQLDRAHHAAMPYDAVPEFLAKLRKRGTVAASALEFTIFTAGRRGEVIGATWPELDLDTKVWTIPAARMKAGREHRVPLSDAAIAVLDRMAMIRRADDRVPRTH